MYEGVLFFLHFDAFLSSAIRGRLSCTTHFCFFCQNILTLWQLGWTF